MLGSPSLSPRKPIHKMAKGSTLNFSREAWCGVSDEHGVDSEWPVCFTRCCAVFVVSPLCFQKAQSFCNYFLHVCSKELLSFAYFQLLTDNVSYSLGNAGKKKDEVMPKLRNCRIYGSGAVFQELSDFPRE